MSTPALNNSRRDFYFQTLRELVRIPSRSNRHGGEEACVQEYVADAMQKSGAWVRCFEASDYPEFFTHPLCSGAGREYAGRSTVLAEFGPPNAPALLVLAHSDTVPIFEPHNWTRDPFDPGDEDDKIYGLGVGDDKWGVAALLLLARVLGETKSSLSKRIILASTIDEESGVGNGVLLLHLAGVRAESALYLDGWNSLVLLGNLGGATFSLEPKSDVSREEIEHDVALLEVACRAKSASRAEFFDRPFLRDNVMRNSSVSVRRVFDEDSPRLLVPFYTIEGEDPAAIRNEMETLLADALGENLARYQVSCSAPWFEPAFTEPSTPLAQQMIVAYREVKNQEPHVTRGSKQDAFVLINHAQIPTVSFGPSRSQQPGAYHSPDEFIDATDTWDAVQVAHRAVELWLQGESAP